METNQEKTLGELTFEELWKRYEKGDVTALHELLKRQAFYWKWKAIEDDPPLTKVGDITNFFNQMDKDLKENAAIGEAWQEHNDVASALAGFSDTIKQLGAKNQELRRDLAQLVRTRIIKKLLAQEEK